MNPYEVLMRPVVSEKSNVARESGSKYTFEIDMKASKKDVRSALKKIYDVDVTKVQTLIGRGRRRRRGAFYAKNPNHYKRAIVQLAEGQTLKIFEDQ